MTEETAEELAEVISPEPKQKRDFNLLTPSGSGENKIIDEAGSSIVSQGGSVTLLSIGHQENNLASENCDESSTNKSKNKKPMVSATEMFSEKL